MSNSFINILLIIPIFSDFRLIGCTSNISDFHFYLTLFDGVQFKLFDNLNLNSREYNDINDHKIATIFYEYNG
jgi:hypothetical protein